MDTRKFCLVLALGGGLVGCSKPEKSEPVPAVAASSPTAKATAPVVKTAAPAASTPAPATATAPAAGSPTAGSSTGKGGIFAGLPRTSSKVPSVAEWNAAPEIKDIPGAWGTAKFEIKNVREWFKVTLKPFPAPHGVQIPPDPVKLTKGKDGNVFDYTSKDGPTITSVVFPMVEGKEREAIFSYSAAGVTMTMTANWARGAPQATLRFKTVGGD